MTFGEFHAAYGDVVRRAREGKLGAEDFAGVTISLTNPGTIGTVHSVPRLMKGQGAIIGAGAMEYPAEFQGASDEQIADLGVGKPITLTPPPTTTASSRAPSPATSCAGCTRCCSMTASSTRSSPRSRSPTSRSAGAETSPPAWWTRAPSARADRRVP